MSKFKSPTITLIFQVFSLTVVFGLYHGLVLLPVLLCLVGPSNQETRLEINTQDAFKAQSQINNGFVSDIVKGRTNSYSATLE